jgi:hypothetical protein
MAVKVIELGFGINLAVNHERRSLVIFFSEQVFAFSRAFKVRSQVVTSSASRYVLSISGNIGVQQFFYKSCICFLRIAYFTPTLLLKLQAVYV